MTLELFPRYTQRTFIGKLVHQVNNTLRDVKTAMGGIYEIVKEQGEAITDIQEQLAVMATKKKATEMISEDCKTLLLPWDSVMDLEEGTRTLEQQDALARLLLSDRIWDLKSRFMSSMFDLVMTKDFRGRMFWATPSG